MTTDPNQPFTYPSSGGAPSDSSTPTPNTTGEPPSKSADDVGRQAQSNAAGPVPTGEDFVSETSDPAAAQGHQAGSVPPGVKSAEAEQGSNTTSDAPGAEEKQSGARKQRIKIGTQRPGVVPPRAEPRAKVAFRTQPDETGPAAEQVKPAAEEADEDLPRVERKPGPAKSRFEVKRSPGQTVEPPNRRAALTPDLEAELQEALGDQTLDELIAAETGGPPPPESLDPESRHQGRVVRIFRDDVFVDLGGRNQGVLPLHQFSEEPNVGDLLEVVIVRFNPDDGLYEVAAVGASVHVGDWSDLSEGMVVDARITGHNKGGLECEVNKIRGFIPIGQVSIYRVENLEEFVGQSWPCVVVEANPDRRNLVLSRRAILEREQAEAKKKLLAELQVGDVREGVVRSIRDFGAFVDLGGVDGLIHISQMSWDRVKHPSDVLSVGQRVKVKVQKIDPASQKISLAYRDLFESPWTNIASKYPATSKATGTVAKIMDFGAFVKLEPGVEGLIHISELSHKRVFRVTDVVKEGDTVETKVLSVDPENQRISLSIKALEARPEPAKSEAEQAEQAASEQEERKEQPKKNRQQVLKGGLGRSPRGDQFGLNW